MRVRAGTILDKTRTPLTTWFEAAWHVTTAKNGMSAKTLERTLGTRYRVARTMLQRYRVAMVRAERERLSGKVEVDETLVGGVEHGGKRGRGTTKKIVVIAVEIKQPKGFGRLRMRYSGCIGSEPPAIRVRCGDALVRGAYGRLERLQRPVEARIHAPARGHSESGDPAHVAMPGVHRVASLLKRWILGTQQGSVTPTTCMLTWRSSPSDSIGALSQPRSGLPPSDRAGRRYWTYH